MKHAELTKLESKFMRKTELPEFRGGDTISVWVKIPEGKEKDGSTKYRLQSFEGTCIRYRKGGINSTFLVRKVSHGGVAVERNFYAHSPLIDHVDVKVHGKVRRSRIYYIKKLKGKAARITSRYQGGQDTDSSASAK